MTSPEQRIAAIADEWLQMCAGCDAGMGPCTCSERDPRGTIQELALIANEALLTVISLRAEVARKDERLADAADLVEGVLSRYGLDVFTIPNRWVAQISDAQYLSVAAAIADLRPAPTEGEQHQ